jgi:hypothetical protein
VGQRDKVPWEIEFLKAIALFDRPNYKGNWSSPQEETEKTREVIPEHPAKTPGMDAIKPRQSDDLDGTQRHLMKQGQSLNMGISTQRTRNAVPVTLGN